MKSFIEFQKEEVELDETSTPSKDKVQDRKTGKWYDPKKEFNKLMDKPEVKAQMKRMAKTDVKEESDLDEATHRIGDYITYGPSGSNGGRIINKTATHVIVQPTNRDISDKIENKDITRNHRTNPITGHMKKEEVDTPFEGPYKQEKGTVTDKSGAKHTPLSNVRSLARNAIEKMKQKMRMAHLSPEVRAEKLARNEELVGGQKKLDIDKDGKIEKSDLETIRTKKLKEDVTTAAQRLKAALDRHTEHAVAANRAGDHDAVKVHQEYANKIKTKLGKLAKNEEVELDEKLEESIASHTRSQLMQKIKSGDWEAMSDIVPGQHVQIRHTGTNKRRMVHVKDSREDSSLGVREESDQLPIRKHSSFIHGGPKERLQSMQDKRDVIAHINQIAQKLKAKKEKEELGEGHQVVATTKEGETFKSGIHSTKEKALGQHYKMAKTGNFKKIDTIKTEEVELDEAEMTDAEMANRENIVKGMKKSYKDFTAKYGDRAKEVMYATATKKAMEEEVEEELEEDMDEGVTTRNGAVTVHKGTYGTSYQPNDDEDDEDTPEKKEPAVKRGRGRPAGADSGANTKGSKKAKTYGGVAVHSLRLPNNNK
jgi:hypothetical protein